jgi:hypothetical protein
MAGGPARNFCGYISGQFVRLIQIAAICLHGYTNLVYIVTP